MRQIVFDTETTGLLTSEGHRIIEVGCVELINRRLTGRHYHQYICPQRDIDEAAVLVHGLTREFLSDKPLFKAIAAELLEFIKDGELVIHNAAFDVGFLDYELKLIGGYKTVSEYCGIIDTLAIARKKHPGQQNSLDALCRRYSIDNSKRDLHGALLDANLLAEVYLTMTGGQTSLFIDGHASTQTINQTIILEKLELPVQALPIIYADAEEQQAHKAVLENIKKASGVCLWQDNEKI